MMPQSLTFDHRPSATNHQPTSMRFVLPVAPVSMLRPDDAAIEGARSKPLTAEQRQRLARCARRAYDAQVAVGIVDGETFDDWRHAVVREATGRAGLRALMQRDYGPMMARLIALAGGSPRRGDWHAAGKPAARDDADRARHALRKECDAQADLFGGQAHAEAYAAALLGNIHKTTWSGADARQLWQVLFTIRNRARAKNRPGCPARPLSSGPCRETLGARQAASRAFADRMETLAAGTRREGRADGAGSAESGVQNG